jgi:hypothetical protein
VTARTPGCATRSLRGSDHDELRSRPSLNPQRGPLVVVDSISNKTAPRAVFFLVGGASTGCGGGVERVSARFATRPASCDASQATSERVVEAPVGSILFAAYVLLLRKVNGLRVPEVDMQSVDLLDQQEDRFPGRADLVARVLRQTRAPAAQLFDLVLVETTAQDGPPSRSSERSHFLPARSTVDRTRETLASVPMPF